MTTTRRNFLKQTAAGAIVTAGAASSMAANSLPVGPASVDAASFSAGVLQKKMASGEVSARALVERNLININNPAGEGKRVFLKVNESQARVAADAIDTQRAAGLPLGPLAGLTISVKDLFDVKGQVTTAGGIAFKNNPPATEDAVIVSRLRLAGGIIIGRTNMVEAAFSTVGTNSHYGTPKNPYDRATGRIPGGSSSGAPISVTDGMAWGAIGSDTAGSVRVPAALCGVVGFKPTASRVPQGGSVPFSTTLDSVGPLARNVADVALLDAILAGESDLDLKATPLKGLRLVLPTTYVTEGMSEEVARVFARAVSRLSSLGATIVERPFAVLADVQKANPKNIIISAEAYNYHRKFIDSVPEQYDPRVLKRMKVGGSMLAIDYVEALKQREIYINAVNAGMVGFDAMIMPTVVDIAPPIAQVDASEDEYYRVNLRLLRNTVVVNLFNGNGLTIPCHARGQAPVGFTLAGIQHSDRRILSIGLSVEEALRT
ncbi:MAG TPA: amidase [Herbaspirillum sp.]|jgi:aspartyl-tRNA(Asn)/glutamyl-tRNA(Gln) amidotransferase subunit A